MVSAFNRPPTDYGYYFIMIPLFMGGTMPPGMLNQRFSINQLISLGGSIALLGISAAQPDAGERPPSDSFRACRHLSRQRDYPPQRSGSGNQ